MTDQATTAERIGVLLVHGVGEQKRFQHLNAEVAAIVTALRQNSGDDDGQNRVRVRVATRPDSPFLDDNETWRGDGPTVSVDLYESGPSSTLVHTKTIDFHEIWWADLDETPERHGFWATIRWYIQFWYWGLTQWAAKPYVADPKKYRGMGSMDPPPVMPAAATHRDRRRSIYCIFSASAGFSCCSDRPGKCSGFSPAGSTWPARIRPSWCASADSI